MALEVEDDVFFADLSRQIALLIMDDEEEFPVLRQPLPVQELPYIPQLMIPPQYGYDQVPYGRRESKGTGVFIPRSSTAPRRKNKTRKSSSVDNSKSSIVASQFANAHNIHPKQYYYSHPTSALKRQM